MGGIIFTLPFTHSFIYLKTNNLIKYIAIMNIITLFFIIFCITLITGYISWIFYLFYKYKLARNIMYISGIIITIYILIYLKYTIQINNQLII